MDFLSGSRSGFRGLSVEKIDEVLFVLSFWGELYLLVRTRTH